MNAALNAPNEKQKSNPFFNIIQQEQKERDDKENLEISPPFASPTSELSWLRAKLAVIEAENTKLRAASGSKVKQTSTVCPPSALRARLRTTSVEGNGRTTNCDAVSSSFIIGTPEGKHGTARKVSCDVEERLLFSLSPRMLTPRNICSQAVMFTPNPASTFQERNNEEEVS